MHLIFFQVYKQSLSSFSRLLFERFRKDSTFSAYTRRSFGILINVSNFLLVLSASFLEHTPIFLIADYVSRINSAQVLSKETGKEGQYCHLGVHILPTTGPQIRIFYRLIFLFYFLLSAFLLLDNP